jgi:hypothetical protein
MSDQKRRLPMSRQAARWFAEIAPVFFPFDRSKPVAHLDIVFLDEIVELGKADLRRILHAVKKLRYGYVVTLPPDPSSAGGCQEPMSFTIPMVGAKIKAVKDDPKRYRLRLSPLIKERDKPGSNEHAMAFLTLVDRNRVHGRHYYSEVSEITLAHPDDPEGTAPLVRRNASYAPLVETSLGSLASLLPDEGPTTLDLDAFDFGFPPTPPSAEDEICLDGNDLEIVEEEMLVAPSASKRRPPPPPLRRSRPETFPYLEITFHAGTN